MTRKNSLLDKPSGKLAKFPTNEVRHAKAPIQPLAMVASRKLQLVSQVVECRMDVEEIRSENGEQVMVGRVIKGFADLRREIRRFGGMFYGPWGPGH